MKCLIGFVSFSRTTVLAPMSEAAKFATRRRPLWPFPMILPLPDGPMDASGGQASNQARLGISTALRADQAELSVGWSLLPAAPAAGLAALGPLLRWAYDSRNIW